MPREEVPTIDSLATNAGFEGRVDAGIAWPVEHPSRFGIVVDYFEDLVSDGLRNLIHADPRLRLVGAPPKPEGLLGFLEAEKPSVVICNGRRFVRPMAVRDLQGDHAARIVVLTDRVPPSDIRTYLAFGVTTCLTRDAQRRDIATAIHLACRGLRITPDDRNADESDLAGLTPTESRVLELLDLDLSLKEIAAERVITHATVKTHVRSIYMKLGVRSRADLARRGTIVRDAESE